MSKFLHHMTHSLCSQLRDWEHDEKTANTTSRLEMRGEDREQGTENVMRGRGMRQGDGKHNKGMGNAMEGWRT